MREEGISSPANTDASPVSSRRAVEVPVARRHMRISGEPIIARRVIMNGQRIRRARRIGRGLGGRRIRLRNNRRCIASSRSLSHSLGEEGGSGLWLGESLPKSLFGVVSRRRGTFSGEGPFSVNFWLTLFSYRTSFLPQPEGTGTTAEATAIDGTVTILPMGPAVGWPATTVPTRVGTCKDYIVA